jgi:predicted MFS family arabinose efflux permease
MTHGHDGEGGRVTGAPGEGHGEGTISALQLWALAAAACVTVGNLYFLQPLLPDVARAFGATPRDVGLTPMLTQIGYGAGMLVFVPLGDAVERRRLMLLLLGAVAVALLACAAAPSLAWLAAGSCLVGFTTVIPHVAVPLAAHLAPPAQRGRVLGIMMGGVLVGILLARTASGFLGAWLGWRAVYVAAALLMVLLAAALRALLPESRPTASMRYPALLRSTLSLPFEEPVLREAAVLGALGFGAFCAFWSTLAFFLEQPPYRIGSQGAGLFGLLGAAGALAAPAVGRLADRLSARTNSGIALALSLAAFGLFAAGGRLLAVLVAAVLLMDVGVQANHVSNLARVHALRPEARSRMNTVYMVTYFAGGAFGTALGTWAWTRDGWAGVCGAGAAMLAAALVVWAAGSIRRNARRRA